MVKRFFGALAFVLFATVVFAQSGPDGGVVGPNGAGGPAVKQSGAIVPGDIATWKSPAVIQDGGAPPNAINITSGPYNVSPTAADNTTGLQAAINAAVAQNKPLYIPSAASCYKYTAPLTVSGNITIIGDNLVQNWAGGINVPLGSPPISGSVLCPTANGSDAVDFSGTSLQANISNLGILFQTTFGQSSTTTGDGFNYIPSGTTQGLSGGVWNNVVVYGHDGNHYAYNFQNMIYGTFNQIIGYGGGLLNLYANIASPGYGNLTFVELYGQDVVGGTANCVNLGSNGNQHIALLTFIRPQCIVDSIPGTSPAGNPPTSAQSIWSEDATIYNRRMVGPDLETNVSSGLVLNTGPGDDSDWWSMFTDAGFINAPAWGANGIMFAPPTRNFNDTTSSGAAGVTALFGMPGTHISASASTTYSVLSTLYVAPPIESTNVSATRLDAIYATGEIFSSSDIAGNGLFISGTSSLIGNSAINKNSAANTTEIGDGTTSGAVTIGGASNFTNLGGTVLAIGAVPTPTGTCAVNTQLGGMLAGSFKANGACVAGTVILTFAGKAATNGWSCKAQDLTTPADLMNQTAYGVSSVTFSGSMVTGDLVTFGPCEAF